MVANKTLVYKKVPTNFPVPGEHIAVEDRPIDLEAPAPPGGLVVQLLCASLDPYLRMRMRDPKVKSYAAAFEPGEAIAEDTISRVLKSDMAGFQAGDLVQTYLPVAEYAVIKADHPSIRSLPPVRKVENPNGLDLGHFLGAIGMPGLTAYSGLMAIGTPKTGETIFVSSAAGAVGQIVGQLAKIKGLKVIGSAGSDEKVKFVTEELGFDAAFNYKKESPFDALPRLAPQGIDIYFENVGGDHFEAAVANMNDHGRIPFCGVVSQYNSPVSEWKGIKSLGLIIAKQILIKGFLVGGPEYGPVYFDEHYKFMTQALLDRTVKAKLSVSEGIEHSAEALVGMLKGTNLGKVIVKIHDY